MKLNDYSGRPIHYIQHRSSMVINKLCCMVLIVIMVVVYCLCIAALNSHSVSSWTWLCAHIGPHFITRLDFSTLPRAAPMHICMESALHLLLNSWKWITDFSARHVRRHHPGDALLRCKRKCDKVEDRGYWNITKRVTGHLWQMIQLWACRVDLFSFTCRTHPAIVM